MIGDKLVITEYHHRAAEIIFREVQAKLIGKKEPIVVTIAGESGSGKSETAAVFAETCNEAGYKALILQQDDYFVYPPKTNHQCRLEDISRVGPGEVRLDRIEADLNTIKRKLASGKSDLRLTKPLVNYDQDRIVEETVLLKGAKVIIIEGTYTTIIKNADFRAFIDRNYRQTKQSRLDRSRESYSDFLEKVLALEHEIITRHKKKADLVIPPPEGNN